MTAEETSEGKNPKKGMLADKENTCDICGGLLRVAYTIEFEGCIPRTMRLDPHTTSPGPMRLCPGDHDDLVSEFDAELTQLERVKCMYEEAVKLRNHLHALAHRLDFERHHELWKEAVATNNQTIQFLGQLRSKADA